MGDFRVRKINDLHDRRKMYQAALNDIAAFETMLQEGLFDDGPPKIGAEQELCIVDQNYQPATAALDILEALQVEQYTNELALFNLEINLDPESLSDRCFSKMEAALLGFLKIGETEATRRQARLLLCGILPTLQYRHLQFDHMTPVKRYQTLSKTLLDLRGTDFEIYLQGVDELIMALDSVLFEACNTSFQLHLQIKAQEFAHRHNWSQMIAGPVLSACTNSPILMGRELWAETRIALFKQSLDTRSAHKYLRKKLPRVYFGDKWLEHSAAELWKKDIMRFPLLVTSDDFQDAQAELAAGRIPNLRAIRLHNGTTYTWNRLCYGFPKQRPHLRIECRYIPSGPSAVDEMANFAFWVGLMSSEPEGGVDFWKSQNFKVAKNNFIKAARTGLHTVFQWYGKNISAKKLLLEKLLPQARQGLQKHRVAAADVEKYLSVFEQRVEAEITGSDWLVKNFRLLNQRYGTAIAQQELVRQMLQHQKENIPVHQWDNVNPQSHPVALPNTAVETIMSTDIFSIHENDSLELAENILSWNNIHHLPVEDHQGNLVGVITDGMIARFKIQEQEEALFAKDIMLAQPISIQAQDSIAEAIGLMQKNQLNGLPVTYQQKLVGIITKRDLQKINASTEVYANSK